MYQTDAFKEIKASYESGKKIALLDFDVYNYYNQGKTIFDVINENHAAGHGYVIKMLLEGEIEVVDGEVVDHIGILNPVLESEMNLREVTATPATYGIDLTSDFAPVDEDNNGYCQRVTPERITSLEEGKVFVFGSNIQGKHYGGAAKLAFEQFGAVMGKGVGLVGQSYAIPTMHGDIKSVKKYVDEFLDFAQKHKELTFLVTKIGCGIAGYKEKQIAPLFSSAADLENIWLPRDFWKVIKG